MTAPVQRGLALGALLAAAVIVALTLLGGGGAYVINARFVDSGQLVKGGLVTVAGRGIGTITDLSLTGAGHANVRLSITDDRFTPMRRGTRATIKAVGLSGVANRFVELSPGPSTGAEITDGGVLTTAETTPIVDLDILLNELDPPLREDLQGLIRDGAEIFRGNVAAANRALSYLNPAAFQGSALARELARDRVALGRLVRTGARMSSALASRSPDIEAGITSAATTLDAVARERTALQSTLRRAPTVMRQAQGTLARLRGTLQQVRPALREAGPVAPRLAAVLRRLVPVGRRARPVLADLRTILPDLTTVLALAPALEKVALPAVGSARRAVDRLLPILPGLRPYAPDLVSGLTNSFGGTTGGYYDANGHYARISAHGGQVGLSGNLSTTMPPDEVPGQRTRLDARCPGAAGDPASDGSSPWVPVAGVCDPGDSLNAAPPARRTGSRR